MGFAFAQPILRDVGLLTITNTNTSVPAIVGWVEALRADTHHPRFRTVGIAESILSNAEGLHPPYEFYDVNHVPGSYLAHSRSDGIGNARF